MKIHGWHPWRGYWQVAWLPRIILEAPLQERTSRVGLRLLRGKVISFHLLITCQSPKKALETFWMAEVAFLMGSPILASAKPSPVPPPPPIGSAAGLEN